MGEPDSSEERLQTNTDLDNAATELRDKIKDAIQQVYNATLDFSDPDPEYFDWVIDRFEAIKTPHPLDFEDLAKAMRTVTVAFMGNDKDDLKFEHADPDFLALESAAKDFNKWDGAFAVKVKDDYFTPFPGVMANHGKVAVYLLDRITTMAHIYSRRRNDAHKIAKQGVTAIEKWESMSGDLLLIFAIVISIGTVFTGVGGVMAAGPLATAAVGVGSGAIIGGTLGGALAPGEEDVPLGSDSIWTIIENIKKALDQNDEQMHKDEEELTKNIKGEAEILWGYWMRDGGPDNPLMPLAPKMHDPDHGGGDPTTIKDGDLVINPEG